MSEGTNTSESESAPEQPGTAVDSKGMGKKKLWLMIAAVVVAILLVSSLAYVIVTTPKKDKLEATISPDPATVNAGASKTLTVAVKLNNKAVGADDADIKFLWSVSSPTLGSFKLRAVASVNFTAGIVGGTGSISCKVTYKETKDVTAEVALTVNPPTLDSVFVDPSTKALAPNVGFVFNASAHSSVSTILTGVTFTWSVTGLTVGQYTLNTTSGPSVNFTALAEGSAKLIAETTYGGLTKNASANITISSIIPVRSVDYRYYDFFEVPFGSWWDLRWSVGHTEQVISSTTPTMFYWYTSPPGNIWIYSNMMLDITGRNMPEINMNDNPEFLPLLGSTTGGNAEIDWYLQYLTVAEMARYPEATSDWQDGWVVSLNGTTTMDKQAAMAVLGVTSAGFDDFGNWWTAHKLDVENAYSAWLLNEGNKRLDIYNMYEYPLVPLTFHLNAVKSSDKVVMSYDIISWGMEAMISRWFHEAFQPTEHWFEDFNMHVKIGPERSDIDVTTIIAYGIYAYETTEVPVGQTHGDPCWVFELYNQDVLKPTIGHPKSDFAPYVPYSYQNTGPGSLWYNKTMPYDYAPTAHNLSANETLRIEFPTGAQLFKEQAFYANGTPILDKEINQRIVNTTANMTFNYAEPMVSDNTELGLGSLTVDNVAGLLTYEGPIDFWSWSKDQTKHPFLADEWDRIGMIPYGIPYVEFTWENPTVARADHYLVSAMSSPVTAGVPANFTVTVLDQSGNMFTGYLGTVNFSSTDAAAILPANYTFTVGDSGQHVFNVTFGTAGLQGLTIVDTANSSLTLTVPAINVNEAARADHFRVTGIPNVVELNTPQDITVTVYDQHDVLFVGYSGTITFGTNRSGEVTLPSDTTIPAGQNHVTIVGGVTFTSIGWFMVNATDTVNGLITGSATIQSQLIPPLIDHFVVTGQTSLAFGGYYSLTVEAINQFGTTFQGYTGTVHFATNATGGTYTLPADTLFDIADNGVKVISAMRFTQVGTFSVNVSDSLNASAYGVLAGIDVMAYPIDIVYTAYDFFEEPWGEWYWNSQWRPSWYYQDYMLGNTSHQYVQLYDPGQDGAHGVIFAPYRFNMTAENVTTVDVHHPEFMPILGGVGPQVGAKADLHIRMQYLDHAWWTSYWYPTWGNNNPIIRNYINTNDGYLVGTINTVELNREAAYEWMGMPTTADPDTWWGTHQFTYEDAWTAWVDDEGNNRLDIYCGYADFFYPIYTWSDMSVDTDGDILLTVVHVNWGYEVLMTRWMTESQLCVQQVYMEDFDLQAELGNGVANVTFDGVAQYNFHSVMRNGSSSSEGAWAWEPLRIDYWPSWSNDPAYHPSDYDPYAGPSFLGTTTYRSWNSGDPLFGTEVEYDATPQWLNLTSYETLIVKLPLGSSVPGYMGKGVGPMAIFNLSLGDYAEYNAIRYNGTADLGYVITNPANPLDMATVYDPITKILTFTGPYDFNNQGGRTGILYHGAPWIEFNITSTLKTSSVVEPTPEVAAESAPAVTAEMLSLLAVILCGVLLAVPALVGARRWDE